MVEERELQEHLRRRVIESRRQQGDSWRDRSARRRGDEGDRPAPYEGRYRDDRSYEGRHRSYDDSPRLNTPDSRDSYRVRDSRERSPRDYSSRDYRSSRDIPRGDSYTPRSEDDYDSRSVFVSQLSLRAGERDLGEFFESHLGRDTVRAAYIVTDPRTKKSQGTGFVEFMSAAMVRRAIDLSGQRMFGLPVLMQPAVAARAHSHPVVQGVVQQDLEHRLPRAVTPAQKSSAPANVNPAARLHVGNLHFDIGAEHVRAIFEPFGEVANVDMPTEPATGRSKGFAFVQFVHEQDARVAEEQLNGFDLAGRQMRVGPVNSRGGASRRERERERERVTSRYDESGGPGVNAADKRAALMDKLSRRDDSSLQQVRPDSIPKSTSSSLVLRHMFDPAKETDPNWKSDLHDDIRSECERFGKVLLVYVDGESTQGEVYIQFGDIADAQRARPSLDGRFFGGSRIVAELYV
ncbi:Phosphatidylinositol-3-phosphatase SAC1 [Malassezia cuniculi]|uniref:Phosphatidylinositol-3-phosphatase SAC1 n=1 Tax=Malassezia cuniculi TaxID=948313 RepID=A0AAF0ESX2_9BASI|nr:Phosphatidylinositol-3-phosphatase SAC1 [Malassezia cuniculi]